LKKHWTNCWVKTGLESSRHSELFNQICEGDAMRNMTTRKLLISAAAIAGAVTWGAAEFIALLWSRTGALMRGRQKFRLF